MMIPINTKPESRIWSNHADDCFKYDLRDRLVDLLEARQNQLRVSPWCIDNNSVRSLDDPHVSSLALRKCLENIVRCHVFRHVVNVFRDDREEWRFRIARSNEVLPIAVCGDVPEWQQETVQSRLEGNVFE